MSFRLTDMDRQLLRSLADHRLLTVKLAAVLHRRNFRALHRRLSELGEAGFLASATVSYGGKQGRPEKVLSLARAGIDKLRAYGLLSADIPSARITADALNCWEHQLLLTTFRVQLSHLGTVVPHLKIDFLSSTSPFLPIQGDDRPLTWESTSTQDNAAEITSFLPDGVFAISHPQGQRTVLFFLEVDMGTEPLVSAKHPHGDIRQKILNYQACFRNGRYKRYEKVWNCPLRGFRLLFLVRGADRWAQLCRLVSQTPPSDFIWLADEAMMLGEGVWGKIWAKGGRAEAFNHSILGSQLPDPSPAPLAL